MERIDVTKYVGDDVKIVSAIFEDSKYGRVLKVETAPIPFKEGDTLPEGKKLIASNLLSIMRDEKDDVYYIGKESKTEKFLLGKDIDIEKDIPTPEVGKTVKALIGLTVKVQKKDSGFLEIA